MRLFEAGDWFLVAGTWGRRIGWNAQCLAAALVIPLGAASVTFSAEFDPLLEGRNLPIRQLGRRRHLEIFVGVANGRQQSAFLWFLGDHHSAAGPSFEDAFARVEPQIALGFFRAVAREALLDQDGPNCPFKEFGCRGIALPGPLANNLARRREGAKDGNQWYCPANEEHWLSQCGLVQVRCGGMI
jgi:hypothetical protein